MGGAKNCPETPRQKMIGMMYLVLTAMLALNVSTDILNGFTMVDSSLHSSIAASDSRNKRLYQDFDALLQKNQTKTQTNYNKAQEVKKKADELFLYLQNFKDDLASMADGRGRVNSMRANGEDPTLHIINNSDCDVTGTYALVGGKAAQLKDTVGAYCRFITDMIDVKDSLLANTLQATLATEKTFNAHDGVWVDWEVGVFDGMPIGASMAVLSKMQNDVRTTEGQIVQYLMDKTDAGDVRVNKLSAYVIPTSNYVLKGGEYSAQIILAAVDTTQKPTYHIEGQEQFINEHGIYRFKTSQVGPKKYEGYISIINDDEEIRLPFWSEYTVAEPAVTISNKDLNIMYRGYDNKFSVSVPGVPDEKIRLLVDGVVKNPTTTKGGKEWTIVPGEKADKIVLKVEAELDGKWQTMGTSEYRVKQLPPPTAFFAAKGKEYPTGTIALSVLQNKDGQIVASYGPDGLLEVDFDVTSFIAIVNGQTMKAEGKKFTNAQINQINKLKKGGMVILQDIRAKSPKGQELRLSPLVLTVN